MRVLWQKPSSLDNSHLNSYVEPMAEYSVAEAKNHLPKLLDRAMAGEEVMITRRGKPIAKIVPNAPPPQAMSIDMDWIESVRVDPKDPDLDFTAIIREMRDEE
jgi:prevent-host-death family protein